MGYIPNFLTCIRSRLEICYGKTIETRCRHVYTKGKVGYQTLSIVEIKYKLVVDFKCRNNPKNTSDLNTRRLQSESCRTGFFFHFYVYNVKTPTAMSFVR